MAQTPENQQSRRDLLKKGAVGATVAGVVWQAPKVRGLSLRPDYAAAFTPKECVGTFDRNLAFNCGGSAYISDSPPLPSCNSGDARGGFNIDGPGVSRVGCNIDGSHSGNAIVGTDTDFRCNAQFEGNGDWNATFPAWDQIHITINGTCTD